MNIVIKKKKKKKNTSHRIQKIGYIRSEFLGFQIKQRTSSANLTKKKDIRATCNI